MPNNAWINKVFLIGIVEMEPSWQLIEGERLLCFTLKTAEEIKKGAIVRPHFELHNIIMPMQMVKNKIAIRMGDTLYVQGRIQTRTINESGITLYRSEILTTNIERIKVADSHMYLV